MMGLLSLFVYLNYKVKSPQNILEGKNETNEINMTKTVKDLTIIKIVTINANRTQNICMTCINVSFIQNKTTVTTSQGEQF